MPAIFLIVMSALLCFANSVTELQPVVIQTENGTCPGNNQHLENITATVRNLLQSTGTDHPTACGSGLWKRITYVNMSDPSQQCPLAWREYSTTPIRLCGRPEGSNYSCSAMFYSSNGYEYRRICGRAIGYQYGSTDAFGHSFGRRNDWAVTIDDAYVDGLSLTHGSPRMHVWTFASGNDEGADRAYDSCYCDNSPLSATPPPSYVGNNYFCESAVNSNTETPNGMFYPNDPLWDGMNCPHTTCCDFNGPPWFSVELPTSTTDDIEARICCDESSETEDVTIALLEIYIQ